MKLRGALAAVAALSLAAAPTAASAAPTARTAAVTPAGETVGGDNALEGGTGGGVFIAVAAFLLVVIGVYIAVKKKDRPNSP